LIKPIKTPGEPEPYAFLTVRSDGSEDIFMQTVAMEGDKVEIRTLIAGEATFAVTAIFKTPTPLHIGQRLYRVDGYIQTEPPKTEKEKPPHDSAFKFQWDLFPTSAKAEKDEEITYGKLIEFQKQLMQEYFTNFANPYSIQHKKKPADPFLEKWLKHYKPQILQFIAFMVDDPLIRRRVHDFKIKRLTKNSAEVTVVAEIMDHELLGMQGPNGKTLEELARSLLPTKKKPKFKKRPRRKGRHRRVIIK